MFDEFDLKIPVQCPECYTGAHYSFQTKDLDCSLDHFAQGEPAVTYGLRDITPEEKEEMIRNNEGIQLKNGEIFLPFCTRDKSRIVKKLDDGKYPVYDYCENCKKLIFVNAIVKDGIFVGVEPCGD